MDLQSLRFFRTVALEGSVAKAAKQLNYAQSNLSTKIKQLESELGVQLFYRYNHGVKLTPKGEELLDYSTRLLILADETENALKDDGTAKGSLRIGSMESTAISSLPSLLSAYHQNFPNVNLTIRTGTTQLLIHELLNQQLDGAFVAGPLQHSELKSILLKEERLVLITPNTILFGNLLTTIQSLPLLVFPYGCSYRKTLEYWLYDQKIIPERIIEFTSLGAIIASVSAGLGISLLPESVVSHYVEQKILNYYPLPNAFGIVPTLFVYRKDRFIESSLRYFIHLVEASKKD